MNLRLKKIDTIIIVVLIIIAGLVLVKVGYIKPPTPPDKIEIDFIQDEIEGILTVEYVSTDILWRDLQIEGEYNESGLYGYVTIEDEITECRGDIIIEHRPTDTRIGSWTFKITPQLTESITPGYIRSVTPEDEGTHYEKILVSREWWYYSATFGEDSDLEGWTVAISFNHMAWGDLFGTLKPDLLVVTLHGPNGEEYGGMINKERGFGILKQPTLKAGTPGVSVTFEDSWAEGEAPDWHVHVEDNDIDKDHTIIIDLDFNAKSDPLWTIGENALIKSDRKIANYMFFGCEVTGTVRIDGDQYDVKGSGHHEHSWTPRIISRGLINGWDWCHMTLDNGWNIYYSNYYPSPQLLSSKTEKTNPFGTLVITNNKGKKITILNDITAKIVREDEKVFMFVKMPSEISINAKPGILQPFLEVSDIKLELAIKADNTYEKIWRLPTYLGMKVGRSTISGKITWSDDKGDYEVDLEGIGNMWSMRALL